MEYLKEAMTLYQMYSANSINEIVNARNNLQRNLSKHEKTITGCQTFWYNDIL